MSPLYPASFSTPCVTPIFRGKPPFGTSCRTRQMRPICAWDFGLACLDDPHRLEKLCLPKRPAKTAKQGLAWEQELFPYSGGESLTQAHTGGTAGTIRLCSLLVFGISSFSGPIPKVLFFVYAAQLLYRRLHPSSPLIMFYRTLLGGYGKPLFSFSSLR